MAVRPAISSTSNGASPLSFGATKAVVGGGAGGGALPHADGGGAVVAPLDAAEAADRDGRAGGALQDAVDAAGREAGGGGALPRADAGLRLRGLLGAAGSSSSSLDSSQSRDVSPRSSCASSWVVPRSSSSSPATPGASVRTQGPRRVCSALTSVYCGTRTCHTTCVQSVSRCAPRKPVAPCCCESVLRPIVHEQTNGGLAQVDASILAGLVHELENVEHSFALDRQELWPPPTLARGEAAKFDGAAKVGGHRDDRRPIVRLAGLGVAGDRHWPPNMEELPRGEVQRQRVVLLRSTATRNVLATTAPSIALHGPGSHGPQSNWATDWPPRLASSQSFPAVAASSLPGTALSQPASAWLRCPALALQWPTCCKADALQGQCATSTSTRACGQTSPRRGVRGASKCQRGARMRACLRASARPCVCRHVPAGAQARAPYHGTLLRCPTLRCITPRAALRCTAAL